MLIYVKLLLMATFWGGTFIAGRIIAAEVGPFSAAFLRFAISSVLLMITLRNKEGKLSFPVRSLWGPILIMGMSGIFSYNYLFFKGLKLIPAGRAAVIVATNPIFIAIFSALFFGEKMNSLAALGIFTSVSGATLVITGGQYSQLIGGGLGWGELFVFGCVVSWIVFSLIGKSIMKSLSPLQSITFAAVVGTAALTIPALSEGLLTKLFLITPLVWLAISYLAVFGTVLGFLWYYEGIKELGSSRAALFINFVPISAVFLAYLLLKETIDYSLLIGTLLVSTGVFLTNRALLKIS